MIAEAPSPPAMPAESLSFRMISPEAPSSISSSGREMGSGCLLPASWPRMIGSGRRMMLDSSEKKVG
jgi:hypothetical protein